MKLLSILLPFIFSLNTYAFFQVIYDTDDRYELENYSNSHIQKIALSTAAMFSKDSFEQSEEGLEYRFKNVTVGELYQLCPSEPFFNRPSAARCSGTLVGEDLILTAGHCVKTEEFCKEQYWIFDYHMKGPPHSPLEFKASQIYSCAKLLERRYENEGRIDYALIKLDRVVSDREAVSYRKSGEIMQGEELFVAGYPMGLPLIITDNAKVMKISSPYDFQANMDTFTGNSGSGVFNLKTFELEGIVHGGSSDFVTKFENSSYCQKSLVKRSNDEFFYEYISKVSNVNFFQNEIGKNKNEEEHEI